MKWIGVVVPFLVAAINLPFFPNPINVISFAACAAVGIVGLMVALMWWD